MTLGTSLSSVDVQSNYRAVAEHDAPFEPLVLCLRHLRAILQVWPVLLMHIVVEHRCVCAVLRDQIILEGDFPNAEDASRIARRDMLANRYTGVQPDAHLNGRSSKERRSSARKNRVTQNRLR